MSQPERPERTSGQFCWIAGLWAAGLILAVTAMWPHSCSGTSFAIGHVLQVAGCAQH